VQKKEKELAWAVWLKEITLGNQKSTEKDKNENLKQIKAKET
jgi:hypothetical protein